MPNHTIAENLQRLQTARTNIATAITTKGGTVTSGDGFEDFATEILNIPTGSTPDWVPDNSVPNIASGHGNSVWTDGTDIYYSAGANQYVLDKSTSTWSAKTWTGLTNFNASAVWTDGTDIYYSNSSNQYVLDKSTSTWSTKSWTGLPSFNGSNIWTDGTDIYASDKQNQYVLDKSTSTWSAKTWTGWSTPSGEDVFTDGTNIRSWMAGAYFKYTKVEGNIPKISTRCKPTMPAPTT